MKTIIVLCAIVGVCFGENLSPPPVDVGGQITLRLIWPHAVVSSSVSAACGNECANSGTISPASSFSNNLLETCSMSSDLSELASVSCSGEVDLVEVGDPNQRLPVW